MKTLFSTVAVLGAMATGSALAADLPAVQPYAAAAPVAHNWTGFYVGANAGYAWGDASLDFGFGPGSDDYNGFVGGIQAGYNHQIDQFVIGLEADIQYSDVDYRVGVPGVATAESELEFLGTVRARLGYAVDRLLPYVTGGIAYGNNQLSASALGLTVSDDKLHVGWTVGAGVEYAVTQNISVKGEYLYVDLGKETYFSAAAPVEAEADFHIARVGLNYKF